MHRTCSALAALVLAPLVMVAAPPASQAAPGAECPAGTAPAYAHQTPSVRDVLGFDAGQQAATAAQINTYLKAVDDARTDVTTGVMATSVEGRDVLYAIVGSPDAVARAQAAAAVLRDPSTPPAQAAQTAASAPAIEWMIGNVHGDEISGGDAALRMLYDLSDRTDCSAAAIRANTVTVIVPTQNPDGRELNQRRNAYGFDLNRDWFAATQPETIGKLALMRQYPPVLLTDNHEMGYKGFFFPPNADPIYHEVADTSIDWINNLYGKAMADEFTRNGWPFFNFNAYDLLYMGYGDTVPTTAFLGAGMTLEKYSGDPLPQRTLEQFTATWASFHALATHKDSVLTGLAANYRQALAEGEAGTLEPNAVFAPKSKLKLQVPQHKVRSYFVLDTPDKRLEARALMQRLQNMGVEVRRLTAPLKVPDFTPYGERTRSAVLPRGTWYIPMAQAQKHWIQAMMGEDSYVPFPYFYDVTAWSNPLLFNLEGGRSGASLSPSSVTVGALPAPTAPAVGDRVPRVGLVLTDDSSTAYQSQGWLRWRFEKDWRLPYTPLQPRQLTRARLRSLDVVVLPDGEFDPKKPSLDKRSAQALSVWLNRGGRLITLKGGTQIAADRGLLNASISPAKAEVPGALIRTQLARGPLARGVGDTAYTMYEYGFVMRGPRAEVVASYPRGKDWFTSGYAKGAAELQGTAAILEQSRGRGEVIAFASDPNFRAYTDGTAKILRNAILKPLR